MAVAGGAVPSIDLTYEGGWIKRGVMMLRQSGICERNLDDAEQKLRAGLKVFLYVGGSELVQLERRMNPQKEK